MIPVLLVALLGLDAPAQRVIDALSEKGCPRLFAMLSPSFQKAVPSERWPAFCDGVGKVTAIERAGDKDGWPTYRARSATGEWEIGLVFRSDLVEGLYVRPWRAPETARTLDEKLAQVGARHHLPGIAARASDHGKVVAEAAWGVRKRGDKTAVGKGDRWHLGSDTKAMTATLAAMLVAEGKIGWRTTVAAALPAWKDLHPGFAAVTLEQLLTHRAGLAHDTPKDVWAGLWAASDPVAGRTEAAHALLRRSPSKIGAFEYANDGYVVAGVILERVAGEPWEALMKKRVFAPLGMASCGFGPPATAGTVDAPWAHRGSGNAPEPVAPGPDSDNPPGVGPAGTVHCSLADWGRFVEEHLRGHRGEATVLPIAAAEYRHLHEAPAGGEYAFGWAARPGKGDTGPQLVHDGSNTMFYASVLAVPSSDRFILVATNRGDRDAAQATHEVLDFLAASMAAAGAPTAK